MGWDVMPYTFWPTSKSTGSSGSILSDLMSEVDSMFGISSYKDDEGNVCYEIEVPGFNKDNLKVTVSNDLVDIIGKRETKSKSHAGHKEIYKRLNISRGQDVEAEVKDGMLYITVYRNTEDVKEVTIK